MTSDKQYDDLDYKSPVSLLLALGDLRGQEDHDYLALGLGSGDVPDLIRLASDDALWWADGESPEVWAPIHAWRALGALRAEEAITPLVALLSKSDPDDFNDWLGEDLPDIFARIGPKSIPPLAAYLRAPGHGLWARVTAASSLGNVAKAAPETRDLVATILHDVLNDTVGRPRPPTEDEATLNGFVISELITLGATESAPTIERAFAGARVDETIAGDLEDVQIALGLRERRETPARNYLLESLDRADDEVIDTNAPTADWPEPDPYSELAAPPAPGTATRRAAAERKAKGKRKLANQSRKQNRKNKKR